MQELKALALAHFPAASGAWSFSFPLPDSEGRLKAKFLGGGGGLKPQRQHPRRLLRESVSPWPLL